MVFVGTAGVARELRVAVVRKLRVLLALLGFMRAIKLLNNLTKCVHF